MQSNFKYIVVAIIVCLSLIFVWQLFWLKGLYTSIKEENEKVILSCIAMADEYEMGIRMDSMDNSPTKQGKAMEITSSYSMDDEDDKKNKKKTTQDSPKIKKTRKDISGKDTTTSVSKVDRTMSVSVFEQAVVELKTAMHKMLDSLAIPNQRILDSLIVDNIRDKGIDATYYYSQVIPVSGDSTSTFSVVSSDSKMDVFAYKYAPNSKYEYRVYMEPLTKSVLMQMSGILGTTILIIIILGFAFWYLIRTVMRQKTLEEMKDDFTNNMTHELKTPIAVAYSATDALLNFKQGENKEKRDKYLTICKEQLSQLTGLVEQILSMSMERRQSFVLNKESISVGEMVSELIDLHRLKTSKDVTFHTDIRPADLTIYADRTHLRNMISNLIDNAIKYSGNSVSIDIEAYKSNDSVLISVKDNGIGISSDKQSYVFEKFYRAPHGNKHDVKGYGLGLFYVKTIAEKHNGTISVESANEKGSKFTIKIPVQ